MVKLKPADSILIIETECAIEILGGYSSTPAVSFVAPSSLDHAAHTLVDILLHVFERCTAISKAKVSDPATQKPICALNLILRPQRNRVVYEFSHFLPTSLPTCRTW